MRFLMICVAMLFFTQGGVAAECGSISPKQVSLDPGSRKVLSSPDRRWQLASIADSPEQRAVLYLKRAEGGGKWRIATIERSGTAFWSDDSKRLFLRDQYAADDTKIQVFDIGGAIPKEIEGLDAAIRKVIFEHIPKDETTQWLYYPMVCFAANDSSTIIVTADAPLVAKEDRGQRYAVPPTTVS
jgi:hypothetical protein